MALSVRTKYSLQMSFLAVSTKAPLTNIKIENGQNNQLSLVQKQLKSLNGLNKNHLCLFGLKNKEFRQMSVISQSQYSNVENRMDCAIKITNNHRDACLFGDTELGLLTNPPIKRFALS